MPLSVTALSLDKQKRWEAMDEIVASNKKRSLTVSYSDTDDISDDDIDEDEEWDKDPEVQVVRFTRIGDIVTFSGRDQATSTSMAQALRSEPVQDSSTTVNDRFNVVKGRKGFTVKEKRPRGKKGVRKELYGQRHHPAEKYDLAPANVIMAVTEPVCLKTQPQLREGRAPQSFECTCPRCAPHLAKSKVKKVIRSQILDSL
jgi:ssDNA-binding Zn-finger/Zn-ribbon topoisomerase 1